MDHLLYRPEEAATVLATGRSKVFELMADGRLQSVKIGRARRITRAALEEYVRQLASAGDAGDAA
jgi:excisionase family DNA binding protein